MKKKLKHYAGIDIGSRSVELIIVDEEETILLNRRCDTGYDPMRSVRALMEGAHYDHIMATGYGRTLFEVAYDALTVTEIKAHARGARFFYPCADTVLDIGGQDSKVIALSGNGRVKKFEMNDRCAAGTGKFMEIMAKSLGFDIETFGEEALLAGKAQTISSMCTVFAESEVTSLLARDADRREIARGIHESIAQRAAGMLQRVMGSGDIVFTGGVARNSCVSVLIAKQLNRTLQVPKDPQSTGALGAALLSLEQHHEGQKITDSFRDMQ